MRVLAAAVIAVFAAQTAAAQKRENRPFNTVNGRTVGVRVAGPMGASHDPSMVRFDVPGSAIAANAPLNGGGRAFARKAFWSGSRRGIDMAKDPPPNFSKPGALIRTAGQAPKYGTPEPERRHAVYAGEIAIDARKARDVGRAPDLQQGPKDTPPPPNPISGAAGGAAPNSTTVINNGGNSNSGAQNNTNGNQGGNKGRDPFADPTGFNDAF